METITILTPTYNRRNTLPALYESLLKQTKKDFLWMVVDDGSGDGTGELLQGWAEASEFPIQYVYQDNGGKHTALNQGIKTARSELLFIVDSDDTLPENAVEIILRYHAKYAGTEGLCGYSFLRCYPDGRVNEGYYPKDEQIDTYVNARINAGMGGDKAEVFYTKVLRRFPFPVYEGEKYVPEDLVCVQMSGPYRMVHINRCVYISEYLEGGLTRSGRRMKIRSPRGMTMRAEVYLNDAAVKELIKWKMILLYVIYGHFAREDSRTLMGRLKERWRYVVVGIPGMVLYILWKWRYKKEE